VWTSDDNPPAQLHLLVRVRESRLTAAVDNIRSCTQHHDMAISDEFHAPSGSL
jgi:hypothetical protein